MVGPDGVFNLVGTFAFVLILINVFLALFNLLPVPPFDGSHIVEGLLPPSAARVYARPAARKVKIRAVSTRSV